MRRRRRHYHHYHHQFFACTAGSPAGMAGDSTLAPALTSTHPHSHPHPYPYTTASHRLAWLATHGTPGAGGVSHEYLPTANILVKFKRSSSRGKWWRRAGKEGEESGRMCAGRSHARLAPRISHPTPHTSRLHTISRRIPMRAAA